MTKETLKLALEALEGYESCIDGYYADAVCPQIDKAITAIKEALAQTNNRPYYTIDELNAWADEKEKKAWRNAAIRIGEELSSVGPDGYYEMDAWKWLDWAMEQKPRGKNSLPPQRTWVGLTNEERADCWETIPELAMRKVEAKLKEKNT